MITVRSTRERLREDVALRTFVISDCKLTSLACDMAAGLRRNRDGLNSRACFIRAGRPTRMLMRRITHSECVSCTKIFKTRPASS